MNELDQRQADSAARLAAQINFTQPVILQAGAGTGKTASLVARILTWCIGPGWDKNADSAEGRNGGDDGVAGRTIDRLVAITFTEKAAAEMSERVIEGLVKLCANEPVDGLSQDALELDHSAVVHRSKALLGVIDRLRVSTIHSFCQRVVSQGALQLGIHPKFQVDADNRAMGEIVDEVIGSWWRDALGNGSDRDAIGLLRLGIGPAQIRSILLKWLAVNATEPEVAADPYGTDRFQFFINGFRGSVSQYVDKVAGPFDVQNHSGRVTAGTRGLAAICQLNGALASIQDIEGLQEVLELEGCAAETLIVSLDNSKIKAKAIETYCEGTLGRHKEFFPAVKPFLDFLTGFDPEFLRSVARVGAPLLGEAQHRARCAGILNFRDLLRLARDLIQGHASACQRLQDGMDQLLLDEVQDTDPLQFEIVKALTDGVPSDQLGLFVVGDPKQSIYGWRQADLAAYEGFLEHLVARGGVRHSLSVNFRSVPAILDEVSSVVAPVMIEAPGLQPPFEDLLVSEKNIGAEGFCADGRRPVEHWVAQSRNAKQDAKASRRKLVHHVRGIEALSVAKDIREIYALGNSEWKDFGILMRVKTGRHQLLDALRAAGIPYVVEGDKDFNRRREILDALSVVGVILDPFDPLQLLGALRTSVVGLPDAAIAGLWSAGLPRVMADAVVWSDQVSDAITEVIRGAKSVTPEVGAPYSEWDKTTRSFLKNVVTLRECWRTQPADTFVAHLRSLTGLEALECSRFLGAHRLSNLQKFFDQLLDLAIETRGSSALTLRGLRVPIVDVEDEEEAIPGGESVDAVRIMSIHKAKGLSFQQVYLLGISGNGKQTHRSFDAAVRGANGRLEWKIGEGASFGYPAFESRETQIRNAEFVRLWYVALTRAKVRVVTVGSSTGLGRDMKSFSDFLFSRKGPMPDLDQLLEWTQPIDDAEEMSFSDSDTDEVLPDQLVALERAEKTVDGVRWVAVDYENLEQDAFGERQLDPIDMNPERVLEFNRMLAAKRDLAKEQAGRPLMMAPSKMMSKDEPQVEQQCAVGEGIGVSVAQSVGTALHLAFEVGDDSPDFAAASQWLKGALSETDLPKGLAVLSETQAALEGRCLLDRFQAIVPSILGREVPLMLKADEPDDEPVTGFSGSIDLLYTDPEDGAIVVADYKTDRVPESQLNAQAEHHRTQGELYTRAARSAFPGAPNYRFEVWFLNHDTII